MRQTRLCPFKNESKDLESPRVIHEPCHAHAVFELFGRAKLETYRCPGCGKRVNARAILAGLEDWRVVE